VGPGKNCKLSKTYLSLYRKGGKGGGRVKKHRKSETQRKGKTGMCVKLWEEKRKGYAKGGRVKGGVSFIVSSRGGNPRESGKGKEEYF